MGPQSSLLPSSHMHEVTNESWYTHVISMYIKGKTAHPPSNLDLGADATKQDPHEPFLISLEQYQDSTGTDNKESFSREPVVLATALLKAESNSDHRSRFFICYIPSFLNSKSSANQIWRARTSSAFGSNICDYHMCHSILLEPIVKAQTEPCPLLNVRLGDQVKHVRAILVMGAILGDRKSKSMLYGRAGHFLKPFICHEPHSHCRKLPLTPATYFIGSNPE
jgi:hypothetical protein